MSCMDSGTIFALCILNRIAGAMHLLVARVAGYQESTGDIRACCLNVDRTNGVRANPWIDGIYYANCSYRI